MKKYNVGMDYLTLSQASKCVAKELGRPRDKAVMEIVYRDLLVMIKNGELPYEKHGSRMYKIKKVYIKDLVASYNYIRIKENKSNIK